MKISAVLLVLSIPGFVLAGEQRCMLQITLDTESVNVLQLCTATQDAAHHMPLPLVAPASPTGPQSPYLPVSPSDVTVQAMGAKVDVQPHELDVTPQAREVQVQISYSFAHKGENWFVVARNPSEITLPYQVVTRRTTVYSPIVRPLALYTFDEEEDTKGAWQYMTINNPLKPHEDLVISVANPPGQGFLGGWFLLGLFLVVSMGTVLWRSAGE